MTLFPVFRARGFADCAQPVGRGFAVESCSWAAEGGPREAVLTAMIPQSGNRTDLAQLISLIGCPVELWTAAGGKAWWGLAWEVELQDGAARVVISLDDMTNRVQVAYGDLQPESLGAGKRNTTGWVDDIYSQTLLGVKESQLDLSLATQSQAEAWRAAELLKRSKLQVRAGFGVANALTRITLRCRGWWETMAWRYYNSPAGMIQNVVTEPQILQDCGYTGFEQIAQSFTVPAGGWKPDVVWLSMRKMGAPAFGIWVNIHADNAGVPGAQISGSLGYLSSSLSINNPGWVPVYTYLPPVLQSGLTYWFVMLDGGVKTGSRYYRVLMDQASAYGGGSVKYWNGAAWVVYGGYDMQFRIAGTMETTEQIRAAAAVGFGGQFLSGVMVNQASGIFTNPYRAGDRTALDEIRQHLKAGTSGGVELLGMISAERRLVVSAKPEASTAFYKVGKDGVIRLSGGQTAPPGVSLAGVWAVLDAPWASIAGGNRVYLDAVEWRDGVCRATPGRMGV